MEDEEAQLREALKSNDMDAVMYAQGQLDEMKQRAKIAKEKTEVEKVKAGLQDAGFKDLSKEIPKASLPEPIKPAHFTYSPPYEHMQRVKQDSLNTNSSTLDFKWNHLTQAATGLAASGVIPGLYDWLTELKRDYYSMRVVVGWIADNQQQIQDRVRDLIEAVNRIANPNGFRTDIDQLLSALNDDAIKAINGAEDRIKATEERLTALTKDMEQKIKELDEAKAMYEPDLGKSLE